jgi:hypothetical protein
MLPIIIIDVDRLQQLRHAPTWAMMLLLIVDIAAYFGRFIFAQRKYAIALLPAQFELGVDRMIHSIGGETTGRDAGRASALTKQSGNTVDEKRAPLPTSRFGRLKAAAERNLLVVFETQP